MKIFEQSRFTSRRAKLFLFDSEMFEYLVDSRIADVIDQLQRAKPRKRVGRFHHDAQKRERIFDVRRFRKPDPAKLAKRNALPAQLDFQIKRMRTRTKQHCDFAERHTFFTQIRDPLRHKPRLFVLIRALTTTGGSPPSMRE